MPPGTYKCFEFYETVYDFFFFFFGYAQTVVVRTTLPKHLQKKVFLLHPHVEPMFKVYKYRKCVTHKITLNCVILIG